MSRAVLTVDAFAVSDGMPLAALLATCAVQVMARDSATLFCASAGGITSVDLRGLP